MLHMFRVNTQYSFFFFFSISAATEIHCFQKLPENCLSLSDLTEPRTQYYDAS